jgi:hypothetical protein
MEYLYPVGIVIVVGALIYAFVAKGEKSLPTQTTVSVPPPVKEVPNVEAGHESVVAKPDEVKKEHKSD